MNYTFSDVTLTEEEFFELKQCVGEFRRICRDQVYRYVGGSYERSNCTVSNKRLSIADNLALLLDEVEEYNKTVEHF